MMMRQFLAIVLLIFGAAVASGQTNDSNSSELQEQAICDMTLAQAPEINGLRLGMTPEQVLAVFPGSKEDGEVRAALAKPASPLGVSSFMISPERYASKAKFAGIRLLTFTLLDGRVTTFSAAYNGPEWKHVDDFIAKFSEGRTLPPAKEWEAQAGMDQLKTLRCRDFEVAVFIGGTGGNMNYVRVQDTLSRQILKERKAKARAQEAAAKEAKP